MRRAVPLLIAGLGVSLGMQGVAAAQYPLGDGPGVGSPGSSLGDGLGGRSGAGDVAAAVAAPSITVGTKAIASKVPTGVVGANHRWPKSGLGTWDANAGKPVQRIVELSQNTKLGVVRYPGGTVANLFDWKKAIGSQDKRGCQVGGGFVGGSEPMDSTYGPDENEKLVAAIGGRTTIMANGSSSSARDIADYVEYMNTPVGKNPNGGTAWAQVRANNGHAAPYNVKIWEVGNEPFLGNQHYWRSSDNTVGVKQYSFGGTQKQTNQPVGTACDHRDSASVSNGNAGQSFQVWYPPVVKDSQTIKVNGTVWRRVDNLGAVGAGVKAYTFNRANGKITFGDGVHGTIPARGAAIRADYNSGPHPGYKQYYQAMKAVDPSISVCASWAKPNFVRLMGKTTKYDCLGPHVYSYPDLRGTAAQVYDRSAALPAGAIMALAELKTAVKTYGPTTNRPFLGVSEYGLIGNNGPGPDGWGGSLSNVLLNADLVAGMIEQGASLMVSSNYTAEAPSPGNLFGGAPNFIDTGKARMLRTVWEMNGTTPVATTLANNPTATGSAGYKALRVVSTRGPAGTIRTLVINRDRSKAVTAKVGFPVNTKLVAQTVNGASIASFNNPEHPEAIQWTRVEKGAVNRTFGYTFPAHSVTLLVGWPR